MVKNATLKMRKLNITHRVSKSELVEMPNATYFNRLMSF